jgi:hypothetical protein
MIEPEPIVISNETRKNLVFLSENGILRPLAELIEKLDLNEEDMKMLSDLISRKIKK